jgi:uncharacterized protein with NAD-binding domain and iron-sulfur cluster
VRVVVAGAGFAGLLAAVPMAVLRDLPFSPGFPPIRRAAWQPGSLAASR